MPEIRCQMCSTLNLPDAETCKLCGARLQPLGRVGTPSEEPAPGMTLPSTGELPAWLARLRKEVTGRDDIPVVQPPDETPLPREEEGSPDWLGDLRRVEPEEEGPPEGEVPDWLSRAAPPAAPEPEPADQGKVPEWLARVRAKAQAEAPPEPAFEPSEPDAIEEPQASALEPEPEPEVERGAPPITETPPALEPVADPNATLGLPDWLLGARPPDATPESEPPSDVSGQPSWMTGAGASAGQELPHVPALILDEGGPLPPSSKDIDIGSISLDVPEWMTELQAPPEPSKAEPRPDLAPATLPAWL
ncbi:MAG TPA: hypothetical protein VFI11_09520, partial [Anaerolineales bacterium]|nr:hypothetical protein [Anaerolineales bacterium]